MERRERGRFRTQARRTATVMGLSLGLGPGCTETGESTSSDAEPPDEVVTLDGGPANNLFLDAIELEGGRSLCLPRVLSTDSEGNTPCTVIEALVGGTGCNGSRARHSLGPSVTRAVLARLEQSNECGNETGPPCDTGALSICEIAEAGDSCRELDPGDSLGWCYVAPSQGLGDERLVENCSAVEQQLLRFVDPLDETPAGGSWVFIACLGVILE